MIGSKMENVRETLEVIVQIHFPGSAIDPTNNNQTGTPEKGAKPARQE